MFRRVRYAHVAPGVDLVFHGETGNLEYDIEVGKGADASAFRLHASRGAAFRIEKDGAASLSASGNDGSCDSMRLLAPIAFQQRGGRRLEVKSRFRLEAQGGLGVEVGAYDHALPLTIDPVVSYTKIIGIDNRTTVAALQADAQGDVVITG